MTFANSLAPVLITGGTGRTGARLARRLVDRGVAVSIGSRGAPVPFDWHDSTTWRPAFSARCCLSGRGEDGARAAEGAVRMCGMEWTVLLYSWFAQNFSEHFLLGPVRLLELTSPRLLALHDIAAELSAATGRQIVFVPCTAGEFATDLANDGIPAEEALPLAGLFTEIFDGRNSSVTANLAQALNRAPTDFSTYASRTANTGLWAAPVHAELQ